MAAEAALQIGAAVLVNVSFAWMVGAVLARFWLRNADVAWKAQIVAGLRSSEISATILCFVGSCGTLWAAAAVMSGLPLLAALDTLWLMLSKTNYGQAGFAGLVILATLGGLNVIGRRGYALYAFKFTMLLAFAVSRVANSHAGEGGLLSLGLAAEWAHLLLVALWAGGVALGGWIVLPTIFASKSRSEPEAIFYMNTLSQASMFALAGIFATGIYNAWHRLGAVDNLIGNSYGTALIVKVAMVLLAVALGAYNKFIGFPSVARSTSSISPVVAVLRVESVVLLAAFVAAAVLTSQQPPASF
jgi:putative copper resistance protein D